MQGRKLKHTGVISLLIIASVGACSTADDPVASNADTEVVDEHDGWFPAGNFDGNADGDAIGGPCIDDVFENNDSFGFPAPWHGAAFGAIACPQNSDFYRIATDQPWTKVVLHQDGDATWGDDNLLLELYCDLDLCDAEASRAQGKAVAPATCDCSPGGRVFVHVVSESEHAPSSGTRYRLRLE